MAEREVKIVITGEDRSKAALASATKGWTKLNKTILGAVGTALKSLAKLGIAATVAFAAFAALSVKTAIEVESAFAGVVKTTDGLVDEFGDLNAAGVALKEEFRALALQVPTDLPELLRLGEVGGQLGIARENLLGFTETMTAMGVATDLTGEQAAVAFARIANVMQTSQEDFDRMGSSVVALGNTFATNEAAIVDFAQRIAAAGEIAGLTEADVFGIAAAMTAVGVQAEAGGTAVQKVLIAMSQAVAGNTGEFIDNSKAVAEGQERLFGLQTALKIANLRTKEFTEKTKQSSRVAAQARIDKLTRQITQQSSELKILRGEHGKMSDAGGALDLFAEVSGLTADAFKKAFQEDAAGAFELFVEGLGTQGDDAFATLEKLNLADQRLIRAFLSLAGAGDLLEETIQTSNLAWDANTALAKEAEQRYHTLESQFGLVKNIVKDVGLSFGEVLTPFIRESLEAALPFIQEFARNLPDLLQTRVVPAIGSVVTWLREKAIPAMADFVAWFKDKALPAFRAFNDFIKEKVLPALGSLAIWFKGTGIPAFEEFIGFIKENVIPALSSLATWFGEKGIPAFNTFVAFLKEEVLPIIGILATWLRDKALVAFRDLATFIEEKVGPIVATFVEQLGEIVKALGQFVRDLDSGKEPMLAWGALLLRLVPPEVAGKVFALTEKLREFVREVVTFVQQHGPALRAALIAIGAVILSASVIGAIAGLIAAINPISLVIGAIAGAAAGLAFAWTENWGGIRDKVQEVWAFLEPVFESIRQWMADKIPPAVEVLARIWNDTLIPAFRAVWEFIRDFIIPMWVSIVELGLKVVKAEIALFINIWNKLLPAFRLIANFVGGALFVAFTIFKGILTTILQVIKDIITWVTKLINAMGQIKLPDFLKSSGASFGIAVNGAGGLPSAMFAQGAGAAAGGPASLSTGARIHIENLNVSGSGSAAADVRNVVTMLEFGTRTV